MQRSLKLAVALAAAIAAASCGGGGGGGSTAPTPTSPSPAPGGGGNGSGAITITITGQNGTSAFNPNPASVAAGQSVVFKNNDTVVHHIMLDDGTGQTADINPGATSTTLSIGSNLSYHCTIHPGMVGGFNGSTGEPPPDCTYQYCAGYGGK